VELHLNPTEVEVERAVRTLFTRHAGADQARRYVRGLDLDVLEELSRSGFLEMKRDSIQDLVAGVLVVEQAEWHFVRAPVAARVIAAPDIIAELPFSVGLVDEDRPSLTRFAGLCEVYFFLRGNDVSVAKSDEVKVTNVATRWGYPVGRVVAKNRRALAAGLGDLLRDRWHLALAAEVSGAMGKAVDIARNYVTHRRQFGRPIGAFQAVQHRLAEAYVVAEGTKWLTRWAAGVGDSHSALTAAAYALDGISTVVENVHQVTGAIGITTEFEGLVTPSWVPEPA
jgi:alkylation response protein AidB-like acyl-CoA dehydrogenase